MIAFSSEEELRDYLSKNLEEYFGFHFVAKEYRINNSYRADILGEDENHLYIIELKKINADMSAFHQIKKYVAALQKLKNKTVIGYLSAPKIEVSVMQTCKKESNIKTLELTDFIFVPATKQTFVRPSLNILLTDLGISQRQLSKLSGVPQGSISRFDKNSSHVTDHLFSIAKALKVPVDKLFVVEEQEG
jgi:predicted XRE-type DNA-binding protein